MSYRDKYLKYKLKYTNLKTKQLRGGGDNKIQFCLFKADWCGHCNGFKSTWNKLLESELANKINFIKYDYEDNKDKIDEYNISGFPTIILIKDGIRYDYEKNRNYDNIIKFLKEHI
jgi:thiol-disulfide isomerase/thioredoxin